MIHRNFIGGDWLDSSDAARNINPSDTTDVIGEYSRADASQVKAAIAAASRAFPSWARVPPQVRADALDKHASGLQHHHGALWTVAEPNTDETRVDIGQIMLPWTHSNTHTEFL